MKCVDSVKTGFNLIILCILKQRIYNVEKKNKKVQSCCIIRQPASGKYNAKQPESMRKKGKEALLRSLINMSNPVTSETLFCIITFRMIYIQIFPQKLLREPQEFM